MSFKPVNDPHDWIVVGSGPSAPRWLKLALDTYPDARIACVNGSVNLLPKGRIPDTYAVFEGAATGVYGDKYAELHGRGVHTIARRIVGKLTGITPMTQVDVGWGSDSGYDKERVTERLGGAMVSGGVELLHAVAHKFRPPTIHCVGFDGYEPHRLHADAAGATAPRDQTWCEAANASMSAHIAAITQAYPKVSFVFYGEGVHDRKAWHGEFVQ